MARRHKKKKDSSVVRTGELATKERCRQQGGVMLEVVDREAGGKVYMKRHRARLECMLDYYLKERRISDAQYMAGMKFREIFLSAAHGINAKSSINPYIRIAGTADPEGKMIVRVDNMDELKEVYQLLSAEQQMIVRNVCGYDKFAGGRDSKRILLRSLDILADHWSFA